MIIWYLQHWRLVLDVFPYWVCNAVAFLFWDNLGQPWFSEWAIWGQIQRRSWYFLPWKYVWDTPVGRGKYLSSTAEEIFWYQEAPRWQIVAIVSAGGDMEPWYCRGYDGWNVVLLCYPGRAMLSPDIMQLITNGSDTCKQLPKLRVRAASRAEIFFRRSNIFQKTPTLFTDWPMTMWL